MNRNMNCNQLPIVTLLQGLPKAVAVINGSDEYPDIYMDLCDFISRRTER